MLRLLIVDLLDILFLLGMKMVANWDRDRPCIVWR